MMMIENLFSLKGRIALVTGGSRGIGKMIAHGFVESGAKVYISARKADACDATAAELSKFGQCVSLPQDISTVAGCKALAEQIYKLEGKLDILVNNAGAAWGAAFEEFPEQGWDKVMNLNVKSPFFLTQALHAALKKAASHERPAKVINICSIDGIRLNPWETYSYHASKSSLLYLTKRATRQTRSPPARLCAASAAMRTWRVQPSSLPPRLATMSAATASLSTVASPMRLCPRMGRASARGHCYGT
jgi:NAD(P)-dependent dehydrogenase (short-subunit alcohol dehydrogenase family)